MQGDNIFKGIVLFLLALSLSLAITTKGEGSSHIEICINEGDVKYWDILIQFRKV
jgi:hypothetical protein